MSTAELRAAMLKVYGRMSDQMMIETFLQAGRTLQNADADHEAIRTVRVSMACEMDRRGILDVAHGLEQGG
jgi:hypothetical protein